MGVKAIDIEADATVRQRTIDAVTTVRANNPSLTIYVTQATDGLKGRAEKCVR